MAILWEWLRYFQPRETTPVLTTIVFGACLIFCGYKIFQFFKKVKNLKLGRDGERVVGQYLESLRESGARIYQDILGDNFNVDHVVISPKGITSLKPKPIGNL